ncbi:hypothetical protein TNCV_4349011 [Trichonephila clavipes]|nr:hypothetical protein TNCV_4349011 [Trichonephila clavipes]
MSRLERPPIVVVWKLGEGVTSSNVILVTCPWFKITRFISKCPRVAKQCEYSLIHPRKCSIDDKSEDPAGQGRWKWSLYIYVVQSENSRTAAVVDDEISRKWHYSRLALSGKVKRISKIRFWILIHHPENYHKSTFFRSKTKAPVTICEIDSHPELSGKVTTISHSGYQIHTAHLKIRPDTSFRSPRPLNKGPATMCLKYGRPVLSSKVMGIFWFQFEIQIPRFEIHQTLTFHTP